MSRFRLGVIALFVVVGGTLGALGQGVPATGVKIKTTKVAGNVYLLVGKGGNIAASITDKGILMVDDQYAPLSKKIKAALAEQSEAPVEIIINTHWHGDHTGGNIDFGADSMIVAHRNVRTRLSSVQEMGGETRMPLADVALPDLTYETQLTLYYNGEEIRIVHYPHSHTDGDSVVFFTGSNVVHMADLYFAGRFPFVDLEHGGNVATLIESVGDIIKRLPEDVKVIPGHGPLSTLDELKTYHQMLIETSDVVRKGIAAGTSVSDLQKAGFPNKWAGWGAGFIDVDKWIQTIHDSYAG